MSAEENHKPTEAEAIKPEAADDASGKLTESEMEEIAGGVPVIVRDPATVEPAPARVPLKVF